MRSNITLPERGEFIIRGAYVLTMDPAIGDFPTGDIHVRDGTIVAVGCSLPAGNVPVVSADGMIALPGFVETHWHLWNSALRALVRGADPQDGYFPLTTRAGPLCTPDDAYRAVCLGVAEGLASGVTTVHDWSHNTRTPEYADAEMRALRDMGVRARFSYGWGQDSALDHPMDLGDLARVKSALASPGMLSLGAAIRTPVANPRGIVPLDVLCDEVAAIRALELPMTMHTRPGTVAVLETNGLLGAWMQLIHPQGITAAEIEMLRSSGAPFSISPVIELNYAQAARGHIQYAELAAAGVQLSLSIDSSAASANADFFACMRALMWSHHQRADTKLLLPPRRVLEIATIEGARQLGLDEHIGTLTPNKRADVILVRARDLNMAPMIDPYFALVYSGAPSNVDSVIVDGRVLRRGGQSNAFDEADIVREATASLLAIRERLGGAFHQH